MILPVVLYGCETWSLTLREEPRLVAKPEGLGRPRRLWVYNIKMILGEIGWGVLNWISLAQYRDK
jgi:hypothetical protein